MSKSPKKAVKLGFSFKTCFAVILVVYFSVAIAGQQVKLNSLNNTITEYNTKIEEKNSELTSLRDKKQNSTSDDAVESIARERLGLVRSDETVFVDVTGN